MSVDHEKTEEISDRLVAAVEAELERANAAEVALALFSVLATVIATMPHEEGDMTSGLIRSELGGAIEDARSKMQ